MDELSTSAADAADERPRRLSPRARKVIGFLLLVMGVQTWLVLGHDDYGHRHEVRWLVVAVIAGLIPPVRRALDRLWEAVARPSQLARWLIATGISIGSALYIYASERYQQIAIHPYFHDESSYLLQMRMLAHGRLWMAAHPLGEFFDTFYVIARPVYASMYFPGTALMYVPVIWLHLPYYIGTLAVAGLCAGLFYLIVAEVLDGALALLAVLILLSEGIFRLDAIMLLSQIPVLLLGLTMTLAWLRWRRQKRPGWLVLLGVASGWAAITRPADALCFAVVIGVAMAMDLWSLPARSWLKTAAIVLAAAAPFLCLQLVFDRAVTGRFFQTPFEYYTDQNYPGARYGFRDLPAGARPISDLPQKQVYYRDRIVPDLQKHKLANSAGLLKDRLEFVEYQLIGDPLLWLFFPLCVAGLWDRKRWALWGVLPIFLLVYTAYPFFPPPTYLAVLCPAIAFLAVLPIYFLAGIFSAHQGVVRTMMGLAILLWTIAALPQADRLVHDQYFNMHENEAIDAALAREISSPAVVLFHFNRDTPMGGVAVTNNPDEEPVYNSDVIWPDDAAVIRAHDLNAQTSAIGHPGDRDLPLYEYYSRRNPGRTFYLYDRLDGTGRLLRLGTASEMARRSASR